MSIALVRFGCTFPLITPSAIALSVCIGVGDCLWPISLRMICMYTASCAMMYSITSSASVADAITFFIMCAMLRMDLLLAGSCMSLDKKKCPPALLRALGSLRSLAFDVNTAL